mmetsp:Transcript_69441/g.226153  ORF Transcript_69441/g.226153 Transcript_69441/m.226153 type:complete len:255 (+) Transcript_69441:1380-2144(+)
MRSLDAGIVTSNISNAFSHMFCHSFSRFSARMAAPKVREVTGSCACRASRKSASASFQSFVSPSRVSPHASKATSTSSTACAAFLSSQSFGFIPISRSFCDAALNARWTKLGSSCCRSAPDCTCARCHLTSAASRSFPAPPRSKPCRAAVARACNSMSNAACSSSSSSSMSSASSSSPNISRPPRARRPARRAHHCSAARVPRKATGQPLRQPWRTPRARGGGPERPLPLQEEEDERVAQHGGRARNPDGAWPA